MNNLSLHEEKELKLEKREQEQSLPASSEII